jgi:hypothetical protein
MKMRLPRPSPAMIVALAALFAALSANAFSFGSGRGASADAVAHISADHARYTLRAGKIIDTDITAHDGVFSYAKGHARCRRGERLISGGLRLRSGSEPFVAQHASLIESGPVPRLREWVVTMNSDLGGAARKDFVVFAYCLAG